MSTKLERYDFFDFCGNGIVMALSSELKVYKDAYSLVRKIFEVTKNFSQEYKYTLGQDMKRDSLQLMRTIYRANKNKQEKCCLECLGDG